MKRGYEYFCGEREEDGDEDYDKEEEEEEEEEEWAKTQAGTK